MLCSLATSCWGFTICLGIFVCLFLLWRRTTHSFNHPRPSNDVKLAHRRPLEAASFVEPFAFRGDVENSAVLSAAAIRLLGDVRLPVREAHATARLVHPPALGDHVVDAEPDMRRLAERLPGVVQQLLVVVGRGGRGQPAALGSAVIAGGVEASPRDVGQETLARDLGAPQTNWEVEKLRWQFKVTTGFSFLFLFVLLR